MVLASSSLAAASGRRSGRAAKDAIFAQNGDAGKPAKTDKFLTGFFCLTG
jgi:hypothetical protein